MRLINNQTGQIEEFESYDGADAVYGGTHSLVADDEYEIESPDGETVKVKGADVKKHVEERGGGLYRSEVGEITDSLEESAVENKKQMIDTAIGAGAGLIPFNLSESVPLAVLPEQMSKEYREYLKEAKERGNYEAAKLATSIVSPLDLAVGGGISKAFKIASGLNKAKKLTTAQKVAEAATVGAGLGAGYGAGEYVADRMVEDKPMIAEALAQKTVKGAGIGAGIGAVLTAGAAKLGDIKKVKNVEREVSNELENFVQAFSKIDPTDLKAVNEQLDKLPDVFKRTKYSKDQIDTVLIEFDPKTNQWKYKDDLREVVVDYDKLKDASIVLDPEDITDVGTVFEGSSHRLYNFKKIVDVNKIKKGNIVEAIEETVLLNADNVSNKNLQRIRQRDKAYADALESWQKKRDNYFGRLAKGQNNVGDIRIRNELIDEARILQKKAFTHKSNGTDTFTLDIVKKRTDDALDSVSAFRNGDRVYFKPPQVASSSMNPLASSIMESTIIKKLNRATAKDIPKWQQKFIRWAGGNKQANFRNKSPEQLEKAAKFISKSGRLFGNSRVLAENVDNALTQSVVDINDAVNEAINYAQKSGVSVDINAESVADFIESVAKDYTYKNTNTPMAGAKGFIDSLLDYAQEWRALAIASPQGIDPNEVRRMRKFIDDKVDVFFKDLRNDSPIKTDYKRIRSHLEDKVIESIDIADKLGNKALVEKYKNAKEQYSTASLVLEIMIGELNAAMARNSVPLTAYMAANSGASIGSSMGPEIALAYAAAGAIGRKFYKDQGDFILGKLNQAFEKDTNGLLSKVAKSAKSFITPSVDKVAAKSTMLIINQDNPRETYVAEKKWLEKTMERAAKIDQDLEPISEDMPELSQQIRDKSMTAIDYLMTKFPDIQDNINDPDWHPSTDQLLSYMRYKNAIMDVDKTLEDFGNLNITKEQTEVLRDVYPETHQKLYMATMDKIQNAKLKQEQKQVLNKVFGLKIDSINSSKMAKFRAKAQQPEPEGRTRKVGSGQKLSGQQPSKTDRITER